MRRSSTGNFLSRGLKNLKNPGIQAKTKLSGDREGMAQSSAKGKRIKKPKDSSTTPCVLKSPGSPEPEIYSETETIMLDQLQEFLLESEKGFTFVGRQVRLPYEGEQYQVDLVFFNRLLRCFVLFDLKIGQLKHQDIGQMQMYVNHYDRRVKMEAENPTIGVLLCQKKDDAVVEMTLPKDNRQIFTHNYLSILSNKEELEELTEKLIKNSIQSSFHKDSDFDKPIAREEDSSAPPSVAKETPPTAPSAKSTGKKNTMVFIDAENVPCSYAPNIENELHNIGNIAEVRYYAMQKDPSTAGWKATMKKYGYKAILMSGKREKNKIDNKIILDAKKFLTNNKNLEIFVIVSKDGDYTELVKFLRNNGKKVVILAPENTSKKLVDASNETRAI